MEMFIIIEVNFQLHLQLFFLSGCVVPQAHRGIKGIVKDEDGNAVKGAQISVRGIRHDVTTGNTSLLLTMCLIIP